MDKIKNFNRLNDVYFKNLLTDEHNKQITICFLNDILEREGNQIFTDICFLDKENMPNIEAGKVSILDIRAKMNDDTYVNVEVQIAKPVDMKKRAMFYWSKLYSYQIGKGEDYSLLKDVISINLLNFILFKEHKRCHSSCHITDDFDKNTVIKDFEMHFIELPKFKISDIKRLKKSEKWFALFSNRCTDEELEEIAMSEPSIKKALEYQNYFMHDEKLRYKYELQEKAIRDYNSSMRASKQEGIREGIQSERKTIAINLLKANMSIDFISQNTGLSQQEILRLQQSNL